MAGRKQDAIWLKFERITTAGKAGCKAKCLKCGKIMQGLVARMKQHPDSCVMQIGDEEESMSITEDVIALPSEPSSSSSGASTSCPSAPIPSDVTGEPKHKVKRQNSVTDFVVKTSQTDKEALDLQLARFVYSTNIPFHIVEHPEFKKLITKLRPGYQPPNRHEVGGKLLDTAHADLLGQCTNELRDRTVSISLDGWSNIHNDPIICASITTDDGRSFLAGTFDTSGKSHTSDYLYEITKSVIHQSEEQFKCHVRSFVTDNAANMSKMRKDLRNNDDVDVITYGCSAHYLNLLAKDVEISGVRDHLMPVIKYFRNCHVSSALYKQTGGKMLVLPHEVRWNTVADCLDSYLSNWPILLSICEEHRDVIDDEIKKKVTNLALKQALSTTPRG